MTLDVGLSLLEATEDAEITPQEVGAITSSMLNSAISGMVVVLVMGMMVKFLGEKSIAVGAVEDVQEISGIAGLARRI